MQVDLFDKLSQNKGPLGKHSSVAHGYFSFPKLEGELNPIMKFQGKEVLTWSINNYLGLANHPEVRKEDTRATEEYGLAYPMGSRMMSGNSDNHDKLEKEISENSLITETVLIDDSDFVFIHDDDDLLETENSSEIEPGSFKKNWLN